MRSASRARPGGRLEVVGGSWYGRGVGNARLFIDGVCVGDARYKPTAETVGPVHRPETTAGPIEVSGSLTAELAFPDWEFFVRFAHGEFSA